MTAQPGIFALGTPSHHHLELDLAAGTPLAAVGPAIARLREPAVTAGGANLVVGVGPELWARLAPADAPGDLHPFVPIHGLEGVLAPATQHDLWVWVHGSGPDVVLDVARAATGALAPTAELAAEQPCFVYHDGRDLTGFVDGTENAPLDEAPAVALVPDGTPGEGGSHVLTMRWVHDLAALGALPVAEQEAVIGRTKPDSVELPEDVRPPTAHISRVVIEERGEELEIFRRSVPFGTVGELGLYFLAFSAAPGRFDRMLAAMLGTSADGLRDRLTDFSRPASGAYYFAPSLEALARVTG